MALTELRVRSRINEEAMSQRVAKVLTDDDYDALLTGPTRVYQPDGKPLCVYLPRAVKGELDDAYPVLTTIRSLTENRGYASGTGEKFRQNNVMRAMPVRSSILGSFEASGFYQFCRLTSWTAHEMQKRWPTVLPTLQAMGRKFEEYVPDRYQAQMRHVGDTPQDWVIDGTPFTTVTVNNTFSTGTHKDQGDLDEGFSCLSVARRGQYAGGRLAFPEYRLAVDMQDGDLILMDAHAWHGNTALICSCGNRLSEGPCEDCGAERISLVCYFRTKMVKCGTAKQEGEKALAWADRNFGVGSR